MAIRPLTLTLCVVIVTLLPVDLQARPSNGIVLSEDEVRQAVGAVSQMFVASKAAAVNFTMSSAQALLTSLTQLPAQLDRTHQDLQTAMDAAFSAREGSLIHLITTSARLADLNQKLFNMTRSCPANVYVCPNCNSVDLTVPTPPSVGDLPPFEEVPAPQLPDSSMSGELNRLQAMVERLNEPTQGVSGVIAQMINQYGEDTQVYIRDVLDVIVAVATRVENARLAVLKNQISSMRNATELLKSAYHHAEGIYRDTAVLGAAASDPSSMPADDVSRQLATFSNFVQQFECVQ